MCTCFSLLHGFRVDYIKCLDVLRCCRGRRVSNPGIIHLQLLGMGKDWRLEFGVNHLEALALSIVDVHAEAQINWKLEPLEVEWIVAWNQRNTEDEDMLVLALASHDVPSLPCGIMPLPPNLVSLQSLDEPRLHSSMIGASCPCHSTW